MANHTTDQNTTFEAVAEEVFRRHGRIWKPQTTKVNRAYLRNQILPWFRGRPLSDITRREVLSWFSTLKATPAAANRSLPILSVILRQAEIYGYRPDGSNPCTGLRRYRERGRGRFLSGDEFRRLGAALAAHDAGAPLAVSVVRLLALTGCRQGEIRTLRWPEYREGHLFLADSKTGPRTIWLSSIARKVFQGLSRRSEWVFPAPSGSGPMPTETLYRCWRLVRAAANLPDVRLHDLRHSYASFAMRRGETVLTIGRLLGHRDPATSLRYTHVGDPMVRRAAEIVGTALDGER